MDNHCKGCRFLYEPTEKQGSWSMCVYIDIMGHRRPCPPGKDCAVKEKKPRKRKSDLEFTVKGRRKKREG